jgi:release factor glutamine methyltransferase
MQLFPIPGVFRPRSDSWMLARAIRERVDPGDTVIDPFTGSGILAIAAAQAGGLVTAIDISRRAALAARLNARLNGVEVEVLLADSMAPLGSRRFDFIVANPPYVPGPDVEARGPARAWEGGPDGRRFIDALCAEAPHRLTAGGRLLLIHSAFCGEEETLRRLEASGLEAEVIQRSAGRLGPLMARRKDHLASLGLDPGAEREEVLIFEATLSVAVPAETPTEAESGGRGLQVS